MARKGQFKPHDPRFGKGGKRNPPGGRPTKAQQQVKELVKKLALDMAKHYLEKNFKPIMNAYLSLASGVKIDGVLKRLDPATCRHAVERAIGPAPRTLNVDLQDSIESFFDRVVKEGEKDGKGDGVA